MTPLIIDDFLPETDQSQIERFLFGTDIKWELYHNTNDVSDTTVDGDVPQLIHGFIYNGQVFSKFIELPRIIVKGAGLDPDAILRAKANMLMREATSLVHPPHVDEPHPHMVMIYYVNDADGDTCIFDGDKIVERIRPKRGRAVFFDGKTFHASSSPTNVRFRCVVNLNLRSDVSLDHLKR